MLQPGWSSTKIATDAVASSAEQNRVVTSWAALSAVVAGGWIVETRAVSAEQAATESSSTKAMPEESASQSNRHWPGRAPSAGSACTSSVQREAVPKVRLLEPSLQRS